MLELIISVASQPTPTYPSGLPVWAAVAITILAGGGGVLIWNIFMRWRTGPQSDAIEISKAAVEQANNAQQLFTQYRIELEASKEQVSQYLSNLLEVNRLLGEANARIQRLEDDLRTSKRESRELRDALRDAQLEHEKLMQSREKLISEIAEMQRHIEEIEVNKAPSRRKSRATQGGET